MKKKIIISFIVTILTATTALFAFLPINFVNREGETWMSKLSDDYLITQLSIPGTHDSGAMHSLADVAGKCQDLSIAKQLKIGVRFFDIRLQIVDDKLKVVHSFVDQALSFNSVLKDFNEFIDKNPSEFLIISIKEDADSKNSTKDFSSAVIESLNNYSNFCFDNELPQKLGDARGKIYLLSRFSTDKGIQAYSGWRDSTTFSINSLYIQDNYCINDLEVKMNDILATIENLENNSNLLHLNFTSCYLDNAFPPTYAGSSAKVINPWLENYLENNDKPVGILICDFITQDLSKLIYGRNKI
ncbi:MAG: phosphatidylinositol-specific phospholipase C [Clostridia bacterium]|nr:phosphatidylinositol-specific phospholipase C [Clostridia bacterium]